MDMNKLEDKGWGSMSQILDKEMPIRKNRKRFFLWFFLLAAVLLATSYFIYQSNMGVEGNNDSEPIALNEPDNESQATQNLILANEIQANLQEPVEVVTNETHSSPQKSLNSLSTLNEKRSDLVEIMKELPFSEIEEDHESDAIINTNSSSPALKESVDKLVDKNLSNTLLKNLIQISALSRLDCNLLGQPRPLIPARYFDLKLVEASEPIIVKPRLKYLLGLSSSWTTDGFFKGFGGTFNMQAPISNRLFVLGGVSIHRYKTNDQEGPSFTLSLNESGAFEDVELPEMGEEMMDENAVTNAENIKNNLEFKDFNAVDFQMGVGMEFAKGLGFWLGGNLKYVFSVDQPDFEPIQSAGSFGSSLTSKSWLINPKLGLYYDIKDRLRIGLIFEKGFEHIYNDNNNIVEFKPLSFTNLQVAYSF